MLAVTLQNTINLNPNWPLPAKVAGEAIIRPLLVGICNTDLELAQGYMGFQGVLGHEFVGIVEQCENRYWLGRRVVGEINCAPAELGEGDPRHASGRTVLGILNRDGVMAQRFSLPIANLLAVPEELSDRLAVFTEPLAAAYEINEQLPSLPARALVLGDGKLGSLCALALQDLGCRVTLVGKHESKLSKLAKLVNTVLLANERQLKNNYPLVIEATGSPEGLKLALTKVQPKGTIVLKTTIAKPYQIDLAPIVINELTLLGSRCGKFAPALQALAQKRIDPSFLIEKTYPLEEALEAFKQAARPGAGKILLSVS